LLIGRLLILPIADFADCRFWMADLGIADWGLRISD
jgi:hypothetical protein